MASQSFERDCEPVKITYPRGSMVARLECASCGSHADWQIPGRVPPERIRKYFIGEGWIVKRRPVCKQCSEKKEPKVATNNNAKPVIAFPNTDAAKKNKRLVIVALEDYFDETKRQYKDGKSDKAVAEELNLAPAFVGQVREEFFGKLAEPDEVGDLRREINELHAGIAALEGKLTALIKRNGWS